MVVLGYLEKGSQERFFRRSCLGGSELHNKSKIVIARWDNSKNPD